jgi:hypothetical protein
MIDLSSKKMRIMTGAATERMIEHRKTDECRNKDFAVASVGLPRKLWVLQN